MPPPVLTVNFSVFVVLVSSSMYTCEYFFLVMMYGGLARETGHVHRPHLSNRNITPEELDGLEAVLKLTERVADQVWN